MIREDILDAAAKVFGTRGYERATLDEVAEIVGIQKGSLYYHIESKEQLLLQIHERLNTELISRTESALGGGKGDPREDLEKAICVVVGLIAENREDVLVCLREYHMLSPENALVILEHRTKYLHIIERIIRRVLKSRTAASRRKAEITALGVIGMTYWVSEWFDKKRYSPDEVCALFAGMVLDGLSRA